MIINRFIHLNLYIHVYVFYHAYVLAFMIEIFRLMNIYFHIMSSELSVFKIL